MSNKSKKVEAVKSPKLVKIETQVQSIHAELTGMGRKTLDEATRCGELLIEAKKLVKETVLEIDGKKKKRMTYGAWLDAMGIPQTTASNYERLFVNKAQIAKAKTEDGNKVESLWDAYQFLRTNGKTVREATEMKDADKEQKQKEIDAIQSSNFKVSITGNIVAIEGVDSTQDIINALDDDKYRVQIEQLIAAGEMTIKITKTVPVTTVPVTTVPVQATTDEKGGI